MKKANPAYEKKKKLVFLGFDAAPCACMDGLGERTPGWKRPPRSLHPKKADFLLKNE